MVVPLPGHLTPGRALAAVGDRPWPVLVRHGGRTIVASDPAETVVGPDVWEALAAVGGGPGGPLAMAGGWAGLLAYDLGGTVERMPTPLPDPGGPPVAALGRYDAVVVIDSGGRAAVAGVRGAPGLRRLVRAMLAASPAAPRPPSPGPTGVTTSLPAERYRAGVERARELIRAGDVYQVNLVQRLSAAWARTPVEFAHALWRSAGPASHRAYLGLPRGAVISASPERLVRTRRGIAWSEPVKGTAAPGMYAALRAGAKDRAEHVMIVDLVRNDLGRVARPGGVSVPRLMARLATPYADHLVSTVRAELGPVTPADVLRAVFPGGSVTGAPKVRAMEVIHELEPVARGPAFGSVVAVGADGSVEASVAIRTAWLPGGAGTALYWCGGAVVWDSDPEAERREAWRKAAPFLAAVGAAPEA